MKLLTSHSITHTSCSNIGSTILTPRMTLSSIFGSGGLNSHSFQPSPGSVPGDRGDISHSHSHGWKGETALSALTLLAFLFFLELLQNCLQDSMPTQAPTVMVMMMDTTTAAARRRKRDDGGGRLKGDTSSWSHDQMSELVSNHVHSYWTERQGRTPNKANSMLHVEHMPYLHKWTDTDVNVTHKYEDANTKEWYETVHNDFTQDNRMNLKSKQLKQWNRFRTQLSPPKTKHHAANDSYKNVSKWWNVIKLIAAFMRPTARTFMCCDFLDCRSQKLERFARKSQKELIHVIRQGILWLCDTTSTGYSTDDCNAETLCTNQLVPTAIARVLTLFVDTNTGT